MPMYRGGKYIVFENEFGNEVAIIFDQSIIHADMTRGIRRGGFVVSAGFVDIVDIDAVEGTYGPTLNVVCHGESESLNLKSRPVADAAIIYKLFT
jgi:hypothetical protein